ncbi:MAG: GNAT family N-acetyltransferase [Myxococcaceae bacterium]|nr:GNAT family N-acetyltransferase [Myxococcaceae bacterium]
MRARRVVSPTVEEDVRYSEQAEALLALCGVTSRPASALVIQHDGVVLAVASYRLEPPEAALLALVTEPNHRHRGLGRRLLLEVARRARLVGCRCVRAHVRRADDAAIAFLHRLGFEELTVALDLRL